MHVLLTGLAHAPAAEHRPYTRAGVRLRSAIAKLCPNCLPNVCLTLLHLVPLVCLRRGLLRCARRTPQSTTLQSVVLKLREGARRRRLPARRWTCRAMAQAHALHRNYLTGSSCC